MTQRKSKFGVFIAGLALIVVLGGCAGVSAPDTGQPQSSPFKHIHGLAVDGSAGYGLAATHAGLYRFSLTGTTALTPAQVGEPQGAIRDDFMGLTSFGGSLFASGHPHSAENASSPNLGLRLSRDAGVTWESVSGTSAADYHALTVGADDGGQEVIYGLDSGSNAISSSVDGGRSWMKGAALAALNIAADPALPKTVYATTQSGVQVSRDSAQSFALLPETPVLYLLTAIPDPSIGSLIGVDVDGTVWLKPATQPWKKTGKVTGKAHAIAFASTADPVLLVSDQSGIALSRDLGATWRVVVTP